MNRFDDTLRVEYHNDRSWIKQVISPTGRAVVFQYCNGTDSLYSYGDTPPQATGIRLGALRYLNHADDTLIIRYYFTGGYLTKVKYPSGDSTVYTYTDYVYYNPYGAGRNRPDWETVDTLIDYDTAYADVTEGMKLLGSIQTQTGATVEFRYRYFAEPFRDCATGEYCFTHGNDDETINEYFDFYGYMGVNKRIADGNTVLFAREMLRSSLTIEAAQPRLSSRTTVFLPTGARAEYFFYLSVPCAAGVDNILASCGYLMGWHPNSLGLVQSIHDADTNTYALGYSSEQVTLGIYADSSAVRIPEVTYELRNQGYYYHPEGWFPTGWCDSSWIRVSDGRRSGSMTKMDTSGLFPLFSLSGEVPDSLNASELASACQMLYGIPLWVPADSTTWRPAASSANLVSYSFDSVVTWEYVPAYNMPLFTKAYTLVKNDTLVSAWYDESEFDSTGRYYLTSKSKQMDPQFSDDTTTFTSYHSYDSNFNLCMEITAAYDTVFYGWDSLYHAYRTKVIDSAFGRDEVTLVRETAFWPNGLTKSTNDWYGQTTTYYYDSLDRLVRTATPLSDSATVTQYGTGASVETTRTVIDTGRYLTTAVYRDHYLRPVQHRTWVSDTVFIADTVCYNSTGTIAKSARSKYSSEPTSWVWTEFSYDQVGRPTVTRFPNGDSIFVDFRSADSVQTVGVRGNKIRVVQDYWGNPVRSVTIDTSGTFHASTAVYDALGRSVRSTGPAGDSVRTEYDVYGRATKASHPDVGDLYTWYDKRGRIRFQRRNSEAAYVFVRYDNENRVVEEGTIVNADTTQADNPLYPDSTSSRQLRVRNRYDTYTAAATADTAGGLGYSLGRLTEQTTYDSLGNVIGYSYHYFDRHGSERLTATWISGFTSVKKLAFDYYLNGALKKITYPNNTTRTYSYDPAGRLDSISGIISHGKIGYEPWGALRSVDMVNDLKVRFEYDNMSRPTEVRKFLDFAAMELYCRRFDYDKGFVSQEWDIDSTGDTTSLGVIRQYTYDALGRLSRAELEDPNEFAASVDLLYETDINGNLTSISSMPSGPWIEYVRYDNLNCDSLVIFHDGGAGVDSTLVMHRTDRGLLDTITVWIPHPDSTTLWDHRVVRQHDYRNLLIRQIDELSVYEFGQKPDTVVNLYDAGGQKVKQTVVRYVYQSGGTLQGEGHDGQDITSGEQSEVLDRGSWVRSIKQHWYLWSGGQLVGEYDNRGDTLTDIHVYGLGELLATRQLDKSGADSLVFYANDLQGSVHGLVRRDGVPVTGRMEYYPYGALYSVYGSMYSGFEFIGKERDGTSELDFGPRYYSAELGRFLAPDPILAGASPYAYANGNPIMFYDPSGLWSLPGSHMSSDFVHINTEYDYLFRVKDHHEFQITEESRGNVLTNVETSPFSNGSADPRQWRGRAWTKEDEAAFQAWCPGRIEELQSEGRQFSCDDLPLYLAIEYSYENNLDFQWENGARQFDLESDLASGTYSSVESFTDAVLSTSGVSDYLREGNTTSVEGAMGGVQTGDVLVMNNPSHIQMVTGVTANAVNIVQGNWGHASNYLRRGLAGVLAASGLSSPTTVSSGIAYALDFRYGASNPSALSYYRGPLNNCRYDLSGSAWLYTNPAGGLKNRSSTVDDIVGYRRFNFYGW